MPKQGEKERIKMLRELSGIDIVRFSAGPVQAFLYAISISDFGNGERDDAG